MPNLLRPLDWTGFYHWTAHCVSGRESDRHSVQTTAEARAHSADTAERHYAAHGQQQRLVAYHGAYRRTLLQPEVADIVLVLASITFRTEEAATTANVPKRQPVTSASSAVTAAVTAQAIAPKGGAIKSEGGGPEN